MGRRAVVAVVVLTVGRIASADEPPPPEGDYLAPAPPPPASVTAPPPPPTAPIHPLREDGFTVDRHGVMLLGGFQFASGDRSQFLVVYVPLQLAMAPRLKIGLTGSFQYQRAIIPDSDDLVLTAYSILPMAQYDWRLPITSSKGDFAIAAESGIGFAQIWVRWPGEPYMPPGWEHITGIGLHVDGAFQFLAHNGLVISVQPIGLDVPLNKPEPPSPMWTVTTEVAYSFGLAGGFRWR